MLYLCEAGGGEGRGGDLHRLRDGPLHGTCRQRGDAGEGYHRLGIRRGEDRLSPYHASIHLRGKQGDQRSKDSGTEKVSDPSKKKVVFFPEYCQYTQRLK